MNFTTSTAKIARFARTLNEVPQITFGTITTPTNLVPAGFNTVAQAIAHGWVKSTNGEWIK